MTVMVGTEKQTALNEEDRPTAAGYHNASVRASRTSGFRKAYEVVEEGLRHFPNDVDLLADALCYEGTNNAIEYYKRLVAIDRRRFTWRAFDFAIDYLIDSLIPKTDEKQGVAAFNEEAIKLANEYVTYFPHDERSHVAKIKALKARNNDGDSEEVDSIYRKQVIELNMVGTRREEAYPVPALSMSYADELLARGKYEEVIRVVRIGLAGSAQEQPSVSIGYLCYLKALAEDALIHLDSLGNEGDVVFLDKHRVASIVRDYEVAKRLLHGRDRYLDNIEVRTSILKTMGGLETEENVVKKQDRDHSEALLELIQGMSQGADGENQ